MRNSVDDHLDMAVRFQEVLRKKCKFKLIFSRSQDVFHFLEFRRFQEEWPTRLELPSIFYILSKNTGIGQHVCVLCRGLSGYLLPSELFYHKNQPCFLLTMFKNKKIKKKKNNFRSVEQVQLLTTIVVRLLSDC